MMETVPRTRQSWIKQFSAGGVVVRGTLDDAEFLAIKPSHRDRWQLPKGTIDAGESSGVAALREVREEGGVVGTIIEDLGAINFFYRMSGLGYNKTVDFFLMRYESGDPADHDHEVQEARWFPLNNPNVLAFASERGLVERSRKVLALLS
jgi:8-oxo-dGTP pyrophosphatase MutT (NUDIX family)